MAFTPIKKLIVWNAFFTPVSAWSRSFARIKRITEFFTVVTVCDRNIIGILFHNVFIACRTVIGTTENFAVVIKTVLCYRFPEIVALARNANVFCSVPTKSVNTYRLEFLNIVADFLLNIWIFGCNVRHTNRAVCYLPTVFPVNTSAEGMPILGWL